MLSFAIFRMQKLASGSRGSGTLGQTLRHLKNHSESAEISNPQNSKYNILRGCTDYKKVMSKIELLQQEHKKHNKRAVKKSAAVAVEFVFSYSKTAYNQTEEFAKQFEQCIADFIKKEFSMELVCVARHTDEDSFHWHLVVIPFDKEKKRFSARELLGDKGRLSHLQTSFAECCKSLGLHRGISKEITKSNHKTKEEHNRQILLQKEQYQKECHQIAEDILR